MSIKDSCDHKSIYHDGRYLKLNENWHTEDSLYKANFLFKIIKKNGIDFESCADIGCGAGLVTELMAKEFVHKNFTGFEISPDAWNIIKKRDQLSNLSYSNLSIFDSPIHYDLIVCLDVFEHIQDYFSFLKSLKSKGKNFIFNIPLDMNVVKIISSGIKHARYEVGHLHYFNEFTAIETLKDSGYIIKSSELSIAFLKTAPRNLRQLAILPFRFMSLLFGKSFAAKIFGGISLIVYAE